MLFPKKVKFRKWQRLRGGFKGRATRGTTLAFGSFGLRAVGDATSVTAQQIEAMRRAITRFIHRGGKVWIRIFPDHPITRRPPEVTMGGGKGDPVGYVAVVKPGQIIVEMDGIPAQTAKDALRLAGAKLPIKVKYVEREQ